MSLIRRQLNHHLNNAAYLFVWIIENKVTLSLYQDTEMTYNKLEPKLFCES